MADKIGEAPWKAFVKKQKLAVELDDKDLVKLLARLDKTDERKPEPRLEVLKDLSNEIPRQVTALAKLKKQLGDKPFGLVKDELYAILEEVEALQKKTRAALEAEEAASDEDDEDSKPSALVDPKALLKQLTMCRKDPDRTVRFAYVDGKDKQAAMLALHPRMSARMLFSKLQAAAGVKAGAFGTAWIDGTSLMLQLDKPLSGLVKKVRAPVKHCGFRISKVVLWNEDGTVFEQDVEAGEAGEGGEVGNAATTPTTATPTAPPQPSVTYEAKLAVLQPRVKQAADAGSPDSLKHQRLMEFAAGKAEAKDFLGAIAALKQVEQLLDGAAPKPTGNNVDADVAFKARMVALVPKIKDALADGHPGAQTAKLKASEAGLLAGKRNFEGAHQLLDEAEQALLGNGQGANAPKPPGAGAQEAAQAIPTGRVGMEVLRNELRTLRAQAIGGMHQLVTQLKADPHPQAGAIAQVVTQLTQQMPSEMDNVLMQMDEAMRAQDTATVATLRGHVRQLATEWLTFLQSNEAPIQGCETNPWGIPIQIDKPFRASLRAILKTAQ
jgi:hypothetical protein